MNAIIITYTLGLIGMFLMGMKVGRIQARKKYVQFLMEGIEENIREKAEQKIFNEFYNEKNEKK